jgi:hypothetical protein
VKILIAISVFYFLLVSNVFANAFTVKSAASEKNCLTVVENQLLLSSSCSNRRSNDWLDYYKNGLMHKETEHCVNIQSGNSQIDLSPCDRYSKTQAKIITGDIKQGFQLGHSQLCLASVLSKTGRILVAEPCVNRKLSQHWHSSSTNANPAELLETQLTPPVTSGKLINVAQGDISCYLELEDDAKKRHILLASFDICDQSLVRKKVNLSFTTQNVMAQSCAGDMNCKESEQVLMVDAMTPLPVNILNSLCKNEEVVYAGCATVEGKILSFCGKSAMENNLHETPEYLRLRYGKEKKIEFEFPNAQDQSGGQFKTTLSQFAGGNTRFLAYFKHNNIEYLYEDAFIGSDRVHGVGLWEEGKNLTFIECTTHKAKSNKPSDIKTMHSFTE